VSAPERKALPRLTGDMRAGRDFPVAGPDQRCPPARPSDPKDDKSGGDVGDSRR